MSITLKIPANAVSRMMKTTKEEVFLSLKENGRALKIDVLTFGMVMTPIHNNQTGEDVGLVAFFENGFSVALLLEGEDTVLLGMEKKLYRYEKGNRDAAAFWESYFYLKYPEEKPI